MSEAKTSIPRALALEIELWSTPTANGWVTHLAWRVHEGPQAKWVQLVHRDRPGHRGQLVQNLPPSGIPTWMVTQT